MIRIGVWIWALGLCCLQPVFSQDAFRLRESSEEKTPCGIYLATVHHQTNGLQFASFEAEDFRRSVRENKAELYPKLTYIHANNGRAFLEAHDLLKALEEGRAKPVIDYPLIAVVGAPLIGSQAKQTHATIEQILKEEGIEGATILLLNRPVTPEWEAKGITKPIVQVGKYAHRLLQEIFYLAPLWGRDYQEPVPDEITTMKQKLATANTFQQLILFGKAAIDPATTLTAVTVGGGINYLNSYATGKYRKVISNWFGRAKTGAHQILSNSMLTAFFVTEIYWGKLLLEPAVESLFYWKPYLPIEFLEIATLEGWASFATAKFSSLVLGVAWRYYYYKAILGWEKKMEGLGRVDDARRTAARFELVGTLLATPAFLLATLMPKDEGLLIPIVEAWNLNLQLGLPHAVMGGIAGLFFAFHKGWLSMDPYVERFDRTHELIKAGVKRCVDIGRCVLRPLAGLVGKKNIPDMTGEEAAEFIDHMDRATRKWQYTQLSPELEPLDPLPVDVRELIKLSPQLEKMISHDQALLDLIHKDPLLRQALENGGVVIDVK